MCASNVEANLESGTSLFHGLTTISPSNLWCLIPISVCCIWGVWSTNNQWFFGSDFFHKIGTNGSSSSETFRSSNWRLLTKSNTHPISVVWVPPFKRKHGPRSHFKLLVKPPGKVLKKFWELPELFVRFIFLCPTWQLSCIQGLGFLQENAASGMVQIEGYDFFNSNFIHTDMESLI